MKNEIDEMEKLIKEFDEKFSKIDPETLTGQIKKEFLKTKKRIEDVKKQKNMMGGVLDFLGKFGVNDVQMGSKHFTKDSEETKDSEDNQFDDLK